MYDYLSIMHYDSFAGTDCDGVHGSNCKAHPSLTIHPTQLEAGESNIIRMGGSDRAWWQSISNLDVIRIAMLYKASDKKLREAFELQDAGGWKEMDIKLEVGGFEMKLEKPCATMALPPQKTMQPP